MSLNVDKYKELHEQLTGELEQQYVNCVMNKDMMGAYNTLGKMMEYRTISKFDDRITEKNKAFTKYGISQNHRFRYDLRKDSNYMGKWLLGDIPEEIKISLVGDEHITDRRDYGYCVDITVPRREFEVEFKLLNTVAKAREGAQHFIDLYNLDREKKISGKSIIEEAEVGFSRMYEVRICGTDIMEKYRTVAYIRVYKKIEDNCFYINIAPQYKTFVYYFINIQKGMKIIKEAIKQNFNELSKNGKVTIAFIGDSKKYINEQNKIISNNSKRLSEMKYLQENDVRTFDNEKCIKVGTEDKN